MAAQQRQEGKERFILELPLICEPWHVSVLNKRLNAARQVYNAVLGEGLKRLKLMRESKLYQQARKMPKGKERTAAFRQAREIHGFREYDLHNYVKQFTKTFVGGLVDADTRQKIATRAWKALDDYSLKKRGRPRFKGVNQLDSVEGKSATSSLRWKGNGLQWGKGFHIPAKIDWDDPVVKHGLSCPLKFTRLVRRKIRGEDRFFAQLVLVGKPYHNEKKYPVFDGVVGLDIGPSTIAIVGPHNAMLTTFCDELTDKEKELRVLRRKMDRQMRANNPDNYNEDGTVKPGKKGRKHWKKSRKQVQTETQIAEIHRKLSAHRKSQHGRLANLVLTFGKHIKTEKISYKAFQRLWGKSVDRRAPGMFVAMLKRKVESAGGSMDEFSTYKTCLSQVCHGCGAKKKKPLSQRIHECDCGVRMQRDLYSAWLARYVKRDELQVSQARKAWGGADNLLRTAWKQSEVASARFRPRPPVTSGQSDSCVKFNQSNGKTLDVVGKQLCLFPESQDTSL